MELGNDESEAMEEAFAQILTVFQNEVVKMSDVYMDNLTWMKALKRILSTKKS